ncbi:hypothetical protein [Rhizobium chutanense]|uniref:hypothetical protein n=1 Tax=Rhizobium chutanense TaxID=2035448 RepID=UPI001FDF1192|nr:hypothetical protein [Rhizobium chutanense]
MTGLERRANQAAEITSGDQFGHRVEGIGYHSQIHPRLHLDGTLDEGEPVRQDDVARMFNRTSKARPSSLMSASWVHTSADGVSAEGRS